MPVTVEIFTAPDCPRCSGAASTLRSICRTIGDDQLEWRVVNVLDEIDRAVSLGVLSTPAIVIDGALAFNSLPSEKTLRRILAERIAGHLRSSLAADSGEPTNA